jgi:diaminopimelate epimerase
MEQRALAFTKYEGAGNDFLVVEAPSERTVSPERAVALCDRHYGVGADGVLLVVPPTERGSRARMVVLNADGSRPEMCGNGLRCVALHLARRDGANSIEYAIETDAGVKATTVERDERSGQVTLGMGRARLVGARRFPVAGEEREFALVDMGNPHAIALGLEVDARTLDDFGPALSATFPGGSNVEAVGVRGPRELEVLVWERGVGRTLACGTGAAAVAVAAAVSGRSPYGEPVAVKLPGGTLSVTVERESLAVTLRGPARLVFAGQVEA